MDTDSILREYEIRYQLIRLIKNGSDLFLDRVEEYEQEYNPDFCNYYRMLWEIKKIGFVEGRDHINLNVPLESRKIWSEITKQIQVLQPEDTILRMVDNLIENEIKHLLRKANQLVKKKRSCC